MKRVSKLRQACGWIIGVAVCYAGALAIRIVEEALNMPQDHRGSDGEHLSYFGLSSAALTLLLGVWAGTATYEGSLWLGGDRRDRPGLLATFVTLVVIVLSALASHMVFGALDGSWVGALRFALEIAVALTTAGLAYRWWSRRTAA